MNRDLESNIGWVALGLISGLAALVASKASAQRLRLPGKVVLITGGSRGLGLLLAREFMYCGAHVAVCARDEQELARVDEDFASAGPQFLPVRCDVSDRSQVAAMISQVEQRLGPIDVLVNNAGTIVVGPLEDRTIEDFEEAMKVNFWSAVHTTLAVLPSMKQRGSGRIVNVSSIGGKIAVPHLLPYSASKFALTGFSQGLRAELQKHGIVVTTVIPGLMRTGSPRNIETIGQHEKEYSWFILSDSIPGLSMDATRAARKIVAACVAGTGELVLGVPAKLAVLVEAVAPNAMATLLAAGNRYVLPSSGNGTGRKKGFQSENFITRSILTALTRAAEARANQI